MRTKINTLVDYQPETFHTGLRKSNTTDGNKAELARGIEIIHDQYKLKARSLQEMGRGCIRRIANIDQLWQSYS